MKAVIVVPCYNEEAVLEKNTRLILEAIKNLPHEIKIVIADNNSKDETAEIGKRLAAENNNIDYVFVGEAGKGAAVMEAWKKYDADVYPRTNKFNSEGNNQKDDIGVGVYGFMDADLAVDLEALPRALEFFTPSSSPPYQGGEWDVVIGSRRVAGAKVERELYRKFTSAILNFIVRTALKTKIKDTPCGFKFMRKEVMEKIVPQVRDRKWVFDTELVILAERAGFKIKEMPVKWEEKGDRKSGVNIYPAAREYIKNIFEIRKRIK